ncbi:MAG: hypothetical protein KatS3mg108_0528 [Isosphaeraceae bacterium]|jgi:hypothetical protein|nr:MAG: hypothetical protein KatS3mg108_0528 [Isosphaeraceae bacterium]
MAILPFSEATVLMDGRVLRVRYTTLPDLPGGGSFPDWMPGHMAGQRLVISKGVAECEFLGATSVNFNMPPCSLQVRSNAASTIPIGDYFLRLTYVDANGNAVWVGCISGEFTSVNSGTALKITATEREVRVIFPFAVPAGLTGRLYMTPPGAQPDDLRLIARDIPSGTTSFTVTSLSFADPLEVPGTARSWMTYWLIPESSRVIYQETGLTVTAPEGLIRDDRGNLSGAVTAGIVENTSVVESDGFTTDRFQLSANARVVYVSSSRGSDANPGTLEQPKATLNGAMAILPNSSGSRVRLLRGDRFDVVTPLTQKWGIAGSRDTPLIFEDYWHDYGTGAPDPGVRPLLVFSTLQKRDFVGLHTGMTFNAGTILVRRLHVLDGKIWCNTGADCLMVSDCLMDDSTIATNGDTGYRIGAVMIHRCSVFNCHTSDAEGRSARVQGAHAHDTDRVLYSETAFDRNGYIGSEGVRNLYSHNVYIQNGALESIMWGSWLLRGGSHGSQLRSGGVMAYNIYARNAVAGHFHMRGGYIRKCVTLHGEDLTIGARGHGPRLEVGFSETPHSEVLEFCISAHHNATAPIGFAANFDISRVEYRALDYAVMRHNLSYDHGRGIQLEGARPGVSALLEKNILVGDRRDPENNQTLILKLPQLEGTDLSWLTSRQNVHSHPQPGTPITFSKLQPGAISFQAWQNLGQDVDSLYIDPAVPTFVAANYGLADYAMAEGVAADEAGFYQAIRTRGPNQWPDWIRAERAYAAFAAAYTPTNLPAIDGSPFGFYGPSDYRETSSVSYQLSGPTVGRVGETLAFTVTPSAPASESIELSDGSGGGILIPTQLSWAETAEPRSFTYTPTRAGTVRLSLRRSGTPVAWQDVVVVRRVRPRELIRRALRGGFPAGSTSL